MKGPLDLTQLISSHSRVYAWLLRWCSLWVVLPGVFLPLMVQSPVDLCRKSLCATEAGNILPTVGPSGDLGLHTFELEEVLV